MFDSCIRDWSQLWTSSTMWEALSLSLSARWVAETKLRFRFEYRGSPISNEASHGSICSCTVQPWSTSASPKASIKGSPHTCRRLIGRKIDLILVLILFFRVFHLCFAYSILLQRLVATVICVTRRLLGHEGAPAGASNAIIRRCWLPKCSNEYCSRGECEACHIVRLLPAFSYLTMFLQIGRHLTRKETQFGAEGWRRRTVVFRDEVLEVI